MEDLIQILTISANRIKELTFKVNALNETLNSGSTEEATLLEAEINCAKLENSLSKLRDDLNNYFKLVNDPAIDEVSQITTIQLDAEEVLCELKVKIKRVKPSTSGDGTFMTFTKLPKLTLPEFEGDILQWHQFWDQFASQVDSRKSINDVDKLLYLNSALRGDAKRLIDGLATTNKNYSIAVDTLKARYGKIELVKDAHYSALNKIPAAGASVTDCRRVLNDIERHLRVLSSLGENTTHSYLRFLILEKFPEELVYELKKKVKDDSVSQIRIELESLISAKEDANRLSNSTDQRSGEYTTGTLYVNEQFQSNNFRRRYDNSYQSDNRIKPMRETVPYSIKRNYDTTERDDKFKPTPASAPYKRKRKSCVFCDASHFNDECDKFKTLEERKIRLKNRCYNCFIIGHRANRCRIRLNCRRCNKQHNTALCPQHLPKQQTTQQLHVKDTGHTILQTAIVEVITDSDSLKCRALFDSGSQRTYITQRLAKKLKLEVIEQSKLMIFTFGSKVPQEIDSPRVEMKIQSKSGKFIFLNANIVPMITNSVPDPLQDRDHWKNRFDLADDGSLSDQVDLLIGNDYYFSLISPEKIQIQKNLYAVKSELGWIISGKLEAETQDELSVITYFQTNSEAKLSQPDLPLNENCLKNLWDLESIGIIDSPKESREEEAIRQFNETTKIENNRYQVSWPWIEYPPDLKPNFGLACGRLVSLIKRLDIDSLTLYDQLIKEQEQKGIIEVIPDNQINQPRYTVHYLPHHGVQQANKPIRIVYDASSKINNERSLNQCLYCGPMMLEDLTGLLLKFRSHNIGICADVEKAFLQIGLQTRDREVTRFLWVKNIHLPAEGDNLLHMRFCRVPFGIIASPFLLNATIKHHLSRTDVENVSGLAEDIYVDNLVTGTSTIEEAIALYENLKRAFQQISMNLREWTSNSCKFMNHVPDTGREENVKVLGLNWELKKDLLHLRIKKTNYANTKRGILKSVASIYDPCGYAVPIILPAKSLLQELWKLKIKWDTPLPADISEKWKHIQEKFQELEEIHIPRRYVKTSQNKDCQLHCFTDASTKAYAAVIYIVQGNQKSFVIGKSRLVPIKDQENLQIPRLELLGVLIGCRLVQYVLKFLQLNIQQQILWTDSQIVIDWYNSHKLLTPFVARRIEEIKRNKKLIIKYVPSELNAADVATRPTESKEEREKWLVGPEFITRPSPEWPATSIKDISLSTGEGLANVTNPPESTMTDTAEDREEIQIEQQDETLGDNKKTLDDNEGIIYTTVADIKKVQAKHFPKEIAGIETDMKRSLGLFLDEDGILRCKGRLANANWTYDKRYPILIPKDSDYTNEIIMKSHRDNYHVGASHTLSIIRQSFWIPHGKRQVLKVIKRCSQCIKHGGGPFKLPPTPALPPERVNYTEPFTFTGVDYLGPVLVKTKSETEKRWICLFTCLAIRAVHLEVVRDLTAAEGLLALRRFVATRGVPTVITSDNATNFKLMSEILSLPYCVERKIKWRFIPQMAPWFGGFYERLIGIVKNCMRRTLQKHLLTDNQLNTVIKEIEAVVNSRPLTYVDPELTHILKPSDFIAMGRTIVVGPANNELTPQGMQTKTDLINSWRRGIRILNEFKEMFTNQYLMSLRERYSHALKQPRCTSSLAPSEGQIVQIKGDSKNREEWQVGKIASLIKGADDLCRVVKVKVGDKEYTRSIAQLYPLEIEDRVYSPRRNEGFDSIQELEVNSDNDKTTKDNEEAQKLELSGDTVSDKGTRNNDTSSNNVDTDESNSKNSSETGDGFDQSRTRRAASIEAMKRIAKWTRSLTSLL